MTILNNITFLYKCLGGSHSYGLNTKNSDIDYRGVFIPQNLSYILGVNKIEYVEHINKEKGHDEFYSELKHFLNLLKKGSTQSLEMLFNKNFVYKNEMWDLITQERENLLDSTQIFKTLKGYAFRERRFFNGERTGNLGSKRKEAIERYGYSYKNAVQLLRLYWSGKIFFETGEFPVKVSDVDTATHDLLMDIKTNPEAFSVKTLTPLIDFFEKELENAYTTRKKTYVLDRDKINEICIKIYKQVINK